MESLERQLINRGYDPHEAEKIYERYERRGRLHELRDFLNGTDQEAPIPQQTLDECLYLCF